MKNLPIELSEEITDYLTCLHTKSPLPRFSKSNLTNLVKNLFRIVHRGFPLDENGMDRMYNDVQTQIVHENILHLQLKCRCSFYQSRTYNFYICRSQKDRAKLKKTDLNSTINLPLHHYLAINMHKRVKAKSYKNITFKNEYYIYSHFYCIDDPL